MSERFPISRYLVPDTRPQVPSAFAKIRAELASGIPATIALDSQFSLVLTLASGVAQSWREEDPATLVSDGSDELAARPQVPAAPDPWRAPLRLHLRHGDRASNSAPVVVGGRWLFADRERVAIEVLVLDWSVRVATIRGAGDAGSYLELAWRRANVAVDQFSIPPLPPPVVTRMDEPPQSLLGVYQPNDRGRYFPLDRYVVLSQVLR
jgi:hypothetical protein